MSRFNDFFTDIKLTAHICYQYVIVTKYIWLAVGVFIIILSLLQWLFNIEQFIEIFTNTTLSVAQRIDIFIDAFFSLFKYANDITPISLILIAALQSFAIVLLIQLRSSGRDKTNSGSVAGSLGLGLIGAGCVACSGSLLTPILGIVASNLSITVAQRIGDILLVIAVMLSYYSLSKISFKFASALSSKKM